MACVAPKRDTSAPDATCANGLSRNHCRSRAQGEGLPRWRVASCGLSRREAACADSSARNRHTWSVRPASRVRRGSPRRRHLSRPCSPCRDQQRRRNRTQRRRNRTQAGSLRTAARSNYNNKNKVYEQTDSDDESSTWWRGFVY